MMQVVAEVSRAFVSDNSFSGNLTRLTMLLVFTVIFRALLSGGIFGGNSTRICRCCRFWLELQTRSSMIKALAGIKRVCPLWRCNVAHVLYVSFPGSRVWLRQCSSPRVDWFDLWIQTAGSCRCWSQQCVLLLLLREQCWYPLHWLHFRLSFNFLTCSCVSWNWCLNRFYWFYALFCP